MSTYPLYLSFEDDSKIASIITNPDSYLRSLIPIDELPSLASNRAQSNRQSTPFAHHSSFHVRYPIVLSWRAPVVPDFAYF
jgi:hypothetical protein